MWRAVTVQAHSPSTSDTAMSAPHCASSSHRLKTRNETQPHKVPTVPGALGDRPLPRPSASQCAGWPAMKRALGRIDAVVMRWSCGGYAVNVR